MPTAVHVELIEDAEFCATFAGEIDREECVAAIAAWNVLQADQDFWEAKFEEFDPAGVGGIDVQKPHEVLVQLNGGDPVRG